MSFLAALNRVKKDVGLSPKQLPTFPLLRDQLSVTPMRDKDPFYTFIDKEITLCRGGQKVIHRLYVYVPTVECRSVGWILDCDVDECMICNRRFNTYTNRKRHCRCCGNIVCGACIAGEVVIIELSDLGKQPTCVQCYYGQSDVHAIGYIINPNTGLDKKSKAQQNFELTRKATGEILVRKATGEIVVRKLTNEYTSANGNNIGIAGSGNGNISGNDLSAIGHRGRRGTGAGGGMPLSPNKNVKRSFHDYSSKGSFNGSNTNKTALLHAFSSGVNGLGTDAHAGGRYVTPNPAFIMKAKRISPDTVGNHVNPSLGNFYINVCYHDEIAPYTVRKRTKSDVAKNKTPDSRMPYVFIGHRKEFQRRSSLKTTSETLKSSSDNANHSNGTVVYDVVLNSEHLLPLVTVSDVECDSDTNVAHSDSKNKPVSISQRDLEMLGRYEKLCLHILKCVEKEESLRSPLFTKENPFQLSRAISFPKHQDCMVTGMDTNADSAVDTLGIPLPANCGSQLDHSNLIENYVGRSINPICLTGINSNANSCKPESHAKVTSNYVTDYDSATDDSAVEDGGNSLRTTVPYTFIPTPGCVLRTLCNRFSNTNNAVDNTTIRYKHRTFINICHSDKVPVHQFNPMASNTVGKSQQESSEIQVLNYHSDIDWCEQVLRKRSLYLTCSAPKMGTPLSKSTPSTPVKSNPTTNVNSPSVTTSLSQPPMNEATSKEILIYDVVMSTVAFNMLKPYLMDISEPESRVKLGDEAKLVNAIAKENTNVSSITMNPVMMEVSGIVNDLVSKAISQETNVSSITMNPVMMEVSGIVNDLVSKAISRANQNILESNIAKDDFSKLSVDLNPTSKAIQTMLVHYILDYVASLYKDQYDFTTISFPKTKNNYKGSIAENAMKFTIRNIDDIKTVQKLINSDLAVQLGNRVEVQTSNFDHSDADANVSNDGAVRVNSANANCPISPKLILNGSLTSRQISVEMDLDWLDLSDPSGLGYARKHASMMKEASKKNRHPSDDINIQSTKMHLPTSHCYLSRMALINKLKNPCSDAPVNVNNLPDEEFVSEVCELPKTTPWEMFLVGNEQILAHGLIGKRNKLGVIRKRQLILTSRPRLFYVDPEIMQIKGEIEWSDDNPPYVREVSETTFELTTPNRTYRFTDINNKAEYWVEHIVGAVLEVDRKNKVQSHTFNLRRSSWIPE